MTVRGWCPTVHEPMATGDGLLVRVKPRGGVLGVLSLRLIAREALLHGNGTIELTSRGNLQVRGLSPEGARRFAAAMVAAGLASPDPGAERRRNVVATPLAGLDPAAHPATAEVIGALEAALELASELAGLPAKFGFLVDGGGLLPPRAAADIRIRLVADSGEIVFRDEVRRVALDQLVSEAVKLAAATASLPLPLAGEGRGEGGSRDEIRMPASGFFLTQPWSALRPKSASKRGLIPVGHVEGVAFGVGVPFGTASALVWAGLAELAERDGDGWVRLTPWRAILIGGVVSGRGLEELGLITDPDDPRLRVAACPGQPGCGSASVVTREIAARLRPAAGGTIHVSGCSKGCAHQGAATLTLVGRDGGFDLVRHGRAGDSPARRGLSAAEVLAL